MIRQTVTTAMLAGTLAMLAMAPVAAQTYVRGNDGDPETLDQHKTSTVTEANVLRDLYEGLVGYDTEAQVIPGVDFFFYDSDYC